MIRRFREHEDIRILEPILNVWEKEADGSRFNLKLEISETLDNLKRLRDEKSSDIFVMEEDNKIFGLVGIEYLSNPSGRENIANECYLFVLPKYRGMKTVRMIKELMVAMKRNGYSHIIFEASFLASGLHDKICRLYEALGMSKLMTSYIKEL